METLLYIPNLPVGIPLRPPLPLPAAPPVIVPQRKRADFPLFWQIASCVALAGAIFVAFSFLCPKSAFDKGFSAGYEQAMIDAGVKQGPAPPALQQLAGQLGVGTNDFEEFRLAYEKGYRTSQNVMNKLARDMIEFQDRAEHPTGY
jgi:hypothetical protein